jgi:hypothetical protein
MTSLSTPRPAVAPVFGPDDAGVVVCIAPGPSLTYEDLRHVYQLPPGTVAVITINDAYRYFPHAQYRFAADGYWWTSRIDACDPAKYGGTCYTLEYGGPSHVTKLDYYQGAEVLSNDPHILATGGHSGYAGINLAYLLRPKTIVCLGYDMQPHPGPGPLEGQHHFGGDEPGQRHPRYHLWIPRYARLRRALNERGVEIWNCSRHTAIPEADVPRRHLDDIL